MKKRDELEKQLKAEFDEVEVNTFIKYINILETQKKRDKSLTYPWACFLTNDIAGKLFKQAKGLGLCLDGDSVTIENKGTVIKLNFNYQAYKNLVLVRYPNAIFDIQNVFDGDVFSFQKINGKISYNHKFGNPFDNTKKIIGCYCIIKVVTGEFIELMSKVEVEKCKAKAKTPNIWNDWESEMFLKTVIKRACKRHFKDIVRKIDELDNEDYDLTLPIESEIELITEEQEKEIDELEVDKIKACTYMKVNSIKNLTKVQAQKIIEIKKQAKQKNENS